MGSYKDKIKIVRISIEVILASHAQKVPHVGCPQIAPVTIARQVNIKPIGAMLFVIKVIFLILKIKLIIDNSYTSERAHTYPSSWDMHVHNSYTISL